MKGISSNAIESIGMVAACFTTLCWAPQAIRILRTRDARAGSLATQLAFTCGIVLWFAYGVLIGSPSIMLANAVTFGLVAAIIVLELRFG